MRYELSDLTITLEKDEINLFWNIIEFALDYQALKEKECQPLMTENELNLARKLADITNEYK